jgi:phosphate transport system permease protein
VIVGGSDSARTANRTQVQERPEGTVSTLIEDFDPSQFTPYEDRPRTLRSGIPAADRAFRAVARGGGLLMLVIMLSIAGFLAYDAAPALGVFGWHFFTVQQWQGNTLGVLGVATGTMLVAAVSIIVSFPLAMLTALYVSEYAPRSIQRALIAGVDLMAAVPSVVYGLWGFSALENNMPNLAHFMSVYLGFIPIFHVDTDPHQPAWDKSIYTESIFIAGLVVSLMVIPISCSVMREVFSQAPPGEREAALALGSTKWGVIRAVVLPFGRGGIVGGTMLGLGRALGETIAVSYILSPNFAVNFKILERGGSTISSLIANRFGDATGVQISALLAAGLTLFAITLVVNIIAGFVVARSRSGAATEI